MPQPSGKVVCIDPQAHKLRVCSHSKAAALWLRGGKSSILHGSFPCSEPALQHKVLESPCCFTLQNVWHHLENISKGKSYPYHLPTSTQCLLTHSHSGDAHSQLNTGAVLLAAEAGVNQPLGLSIKSGWLQGMLSGFSSSQGMALAMELRKTTKPRGNRMYVSSYGQHSDNVILWILFNL